jgi:hypothetical protein
MSGQRLDWIAIAVAVLAALFSGLQWWETRDWRKLTFAAALSFEIDTLAGRHVGMGVRNAGPGVARIQTVTYYLDGKPVEDIGNAFENAGLDSDRDEGVDLDSGDLLTPGQIAWLIDYRPKNREDADRARDLVDAHIQVAINYCTIYEACMRACSDFVGCPVQQPIPVKN